MKACLSDPAEVRSQDPDAIEAEYMWLSDVDFDGCKVKGTLLNAPHSLKSGAVNRSLPPKSSDSKIA